MQISPRFSCLLAGVLLGLPATTPAAPLLPPWSVQSLQAHTPELVVDIDGRAVHARREHARYLESGDLAWAGTWDATDGTAAGEVILVRSTAGITAVVRMGEELQRIIPIGGGRHLRLPLDTRWLPAHPPGHDALSRTALPISAAPGGPAATSVIRLLVMATADAVAGYPGDLRALAELSIAESNQTYRRSGLDIRLELAAYVVTPYGESGNMELDVQRFQSPGDGHMDEVHALRDRHAADVAVLLLDRAFGCGLASEIGATARTAFIAVLQECATGQYTLAHEVGHLAGARHDIKRDPGSMPFAFGHGFWYQPPRVLGWRTVMSYDCPTGCRRVPYWSSPDLRHEGVATGNVAEADNRRVLEMMRDTLAGFR